MVTQPTKRQLYVQREPAGTGRVAAVLTTPFPQLTEGRESVRKHGFRTWMQIYNFLKRDTWSLGVFQLQNPWKESWPDVYLKC